MSYVTKDTVWPKSAAIDATVKNLVDLFYTLADTTGQEAGPRMASDVFTETARMVAGTGEFSGSEAISRSRDNAWKHISERHHAIQRVYVNDHEACDLMVLGRVKMDFRNGKTLDQEFAARLLVNEESKAAGRPRLELMQVFADSAPTLAALKES